MVRVKDSIRLRLEKMVDRYEEIGRSLADPAVIGRQREFRELSVEYARLTPVAEKFGAYRALERELGSAREMQHDGDPGMREMGSEEITRLEPQLERIDEALKMLLIPRDPRDEKNIYLEVRAGTKSSVASRATAPLRVSSSNPACTACSAFPKPKRRAASTPRR